MMAESLRDWLTARVAALTDPPVDAVPGDMPVAALGLTSRKLLGLVDEMSHHLDRPLDPLLPYRYPTIDAMCEYLLQGPAAVATAHVPQATPAIDRDMAVIGLACRFPGAADPDSYWRNLLSGRDAVRELPEGRPDSETFVRHCRDAAMEMPVRGGFVDGIELFDNGFFRISPNEARMMDPQQRQLLQLVREALADAGLNAADLSGSRTGIFVGISQSDYRLDLDGGVEAGALAVTGNALSICANRLSYHYNFRGPSIAVDTACSSSLVAAKIALDSLRRGECDLALVAGVNLLLDGRTQGMLHRAGMLSPDYRCATFDDGANGYVRSEGVGMVVLQPTAAARAQRNRIYSVIKGAAVNQDGRSNGLTAPMPQAQVDVIRAACADAGVDPIAVSFVEAHGTGTPLGDPIEAGALSAAYCRDRSGDEPLPIGSVKSNIGHLEAAAGIAALIKTSLALHHGQVPSNLHFDRLNSHIDGDALKIRVIDKTLIREPSTGPWMAGISSFGFGGTNCHMILAATEPSMVSHAADDRVVPIRITAASEEALDRQLMRWETFSATAAASSIADVAYSATIRRPEAKWQTTFLASDSVDLAQQIAASRARGRLKSRPSEPPQQCFVFTGQGEHWKDMSAWLPHASPLFSSILRRCDEHAADVGLDFSIVEAVSATPAIFDDPARAQPCIVALQIAMLAEARRHGLVPIAAIGHSVGEIAAAVACGMLDTEEAMRIAVCRAGAVLGAPAGGALSVALSEKEAMAVVRKLGLPLALAAINATESVVLSGPLDAVEALDAHVRADGIMSHWVSRSAGFHSHLMDQASQELKARLGAVAFRPANIVLLSSTLGRAVDGDALDADYWANNLRGTVRFASALADRPVAPATELCIEFSPRSVLSGPIRRSTESDASPLLDARADPNARMAAGLKNLAESGAIVDWSPIVPRHARLVTLPPPDWDLHAFWKQVKSEVDSRGDGSLLGRDVLRRGAGLRAWVSDVNVRAFPSLADHVVGQYAVMPAAAQLAIMADAIGAGVSDPLIALADATFVRPILVQEEESSIQTIVERQGDESTIELSAAGETAEPLVFATARSFAAENPAAVAIDAIRARCPSMLTANDLYTRLGESAIRYGTSFALVDTVYIGRDEAVADLKPVPDGRLNRHGPDCRQIDAAMHPLLALLAARGGSSRTIDKAIPASIERFTLVRDAVDARWTHVVLRDVSGDRAVIDGTLYDGTGRVVAELQGMALALGRSASTGGALAREGVFTYRREWQEDRHVAAAAGITGPPRAVAINAARALDVAHAAAALIRRDARCFVVVERQEDRRHDDDLWIDDSDETAVLLKRLGEAGHEKLSALVDLRYLDAGLPAWTGAAIRDAADAARRSMASASLAADAPERIIFVTPRGIVGDRLTIAPQAAPVWGLARCLPFENPMATCKCLLVDAAASVDVLGDAIVQELQSDAEMEVARIGGQRFVRRLRPLPRAIDAQDSDIAGGAALITGATGGLAPAIITWLIDRDIRNLVCVGRQPEAGPIADYHADVRARGVTICYLQADISDAAQVTAALAGLPTSFPAIRAFIHAAGHLEDEPLLSGSSTAFHRVTTPKVDGLCNVLAALPKDQLRWVLLFSSAAGTIGSPGQGAYAAGNAFLDALADDAAADGPHICSIGWGPWGDVGMAQRGGRVIEELSTGLNFLSQDQGYAAMTAILDGGIRHSLATAFDLKNLVQFYPQGPGFQLFRSLFDAGEVIPRSVGDAAELNHRNNVVAEYVAPRTPVESVLAGIWQRSLGVERVGVDDSFFELGGDSVFGNQIIVEIGNKTGVMLKPEQVFEHFTIASLAQLIESAVADRIEAMSDSEAEELLAKLSIA